MSAPSASAPPALAVERLNAWYGAAQVLYAWRSPSGAARWWR